MTRVSFGNPVTGRIRPPGSPKVVGSFRVTATFQQHIDGHRNPGVDISNGGSGDPILAMADGKVSRAGLMGAAKVVRILHDAFDDPLESGYAHLATIDVKLGSRVTRGQRIGTLGKTGADAFHLHLGLKRGKTEIDAWPLLDQNQETDMLKGSHPARLVNRKGLILGDHTRFRESPSATASIIRTYDKDTEIRPDFIVEGGSVNGSVQWYATWGTTAQGIEFGYIHASTVGPLEPIEPA
jgi:murein DD-endopeptidase MepM/ murein hydrolase activator NlpD